MRIYENVTRAIIEEMERGAVPWVRPWKTDRHNISSVMPANAITGRSYSGIAAVMQTRSRKVEMPSGLSLPLAFGMKTRLIGSGR